MPSEPRVRPLQLVTAEELAELGWKPQRPIWEHSEAVGRTGAGKRPAGDFAAFVDEAPPLLRLRPYPEPPEAA